MFNCCDNVVKHDYQFPTVGIGMPHGMPIPTVGMRIGMPHGMLLGHMRDNPTFFLHSLFLILLPNSNSYQNLSAS